MTTWNSLPIDIQNYILDLAVKLYYNNLIKHFDLICVSLDARLLEHEAVLKTKAKTIGTTVFCCTYERLRGYRFTRVNTRLVESPYTEFQIEYTQTFGNKHIDAFRDTRGVTKLRMNNDPTDLPLHLVVENLNQCSYITIDHIKQLLTLNKQKFKKNLRKPELINLFLKMN